MGRKLIVQLPLPIEFLLAITIIKIRQLLINSNNNYNKTILVIIIFSNFNCLIKLINNNNSQLKIKKMSNNFLFLIGTFSVFYKQLKTLILIKRKN